MHRLPLLLIILLIPVLATAEIEVNHFNDPEQEATYTQLIHELRCLVCQNQNLADSNADMAKEMRHKTYQLVKGGASYDDVADFMARRYGDFVLYRPPFNISTLLLWVGPFLILGGALFFLISLIRKRNQEAPVKLSDSDHKRAQNLLDEEDKDS